MTTRLALTAYLVPDYAAGLAFLTQGLGWAVFEDRDMGGGKRWVTLGPAGGAAQLLLARAVGVQTAAIGQQGGGRVWLFLHSDDFAADAARLRAHGAIFEEQPRHEPYGTVAVFRDPFGNRWDLIEPAARA